MTLMKWDPFKDLLSLQERINRLFEDSLTKIQFRDDDLSFGSWSPPADVYETEKSFIVKVELPGMDTEDFGVNIKNRTLTIKGERRFKKEVKQEKFHRVERVYGPFQRVFLLPGGIDSEGVEAKFLNGVLEVVIPKSETENSKRYKIKVE